MRFGSLSGRGYSLMAVCGSKFDPPILPSPPDVPFRENPDIVRAAIGAVRRARLVSYIERGILHPSALRNPGLHEDPRDEYCIHLILHRGNCMLGAIRCQFHRRKPAQDDPVPFFREVIHRNGLPPEICRSVESHLDAIHPGYVTHAEISAWVGNPDLKHSQIIGLSSLLSVWSLGKVFPGMPNVSVLRSSNAAAKTLEQFGGTRLTHEGNHLVVQDSFFKGPVEWMFTHSQNYQERIAPLIEDMAGMLTELGITRAAPGRTHGVSQP